MLSRSQVQVLAGARTLERCLNWVLSSLRLGPGIVRTAYLLWDRSPLLVHLLHTLASPSSPLTCYRAGQGPYQKPSMWWATSYQSPHSKQTASLSKLSIIRYSVTTAENRLRPPYSTLCNQGNFIGLFFVFFFSKYMTLLFSLTFHWGNFSKFYWSLANGHLVS